jgi:aquaporin TIP
MRRGLEQLLIVEFIGPFALTFIGAGSIVATGGQNLVAIALAHGLAIGLLVAAAGHISGGVYNPALTVALAATRQLPWDRAIAYIVVQCLGAIVAALLLKAVVAPAAAAAVNLGNPGLGPGVTPIQGLIVEIILTFFLMFSVWGSAIDSRGPATIAGLVIGLTITMDVFMGGGLTGAAMNPSRWIGTAVAQGDFTNWWLYWVGPIIGALLAAFLYRYVLLERPEVREPSVELPQP